MPVNHVRMTEDQETRLNLWLHENINDIEDRIEMRVRLWRLWREMYEGKVGEKTFPWKGCSNVYVPLTGIIVDAIHANMMNRLFGFDRVWDVTATKSAEVVGTNPVDGQPITWTDLATEVQEYLAYESGQTGTMEVYDTAHEAVMECIKLGSSVVYSPWLTLTQRDYELDPDGGIITKGVPTTVFDGIRPKVIPLEDFMILPGYSKIHGPEASPLVGHKYWLRWGQVKQYQDAGLFRPTATRAIKGQTGSWGDDERLKDFQEQLEEQYADHTDIRKNDYRLYDLWINYDINDDGFEESLYVTWHRDSQAVLRIQPFIYRTRPYVDFHYVRREHRFYSIGVPEMMESVQRGINSNFNQTIDNVTVANIRAYKIKRGSLTARTVGDIYPGKKVLVDDMDDIADLPMGEVYPSAFQVGLLFRDFAERRTGISDFNLGRESEVLGRASTATTTMALLQESTRRFDLYAKNIRNAVSEMGMQTLELIQRMKPTGRIYAVMGEKGELVERTVMLPEGVNVREHLKINTTSAAASSNKEVMRQNSLTAFGLLTQYMDKLLQLAQILANPMIPEPMRKLAYDMSQTAERLMQRVLEGFDLPDIAAFLPQMENLIGAAQQQIQGPQGLVPSGGGMAAAGGAPGGAGPIGFPGPGDGGGLPPGPGAPGPEAGL